MEQMMNSKENGGSWFRGLRGPLSLAALMLTAFLAVQTVNAIKSFNYIGNGPGDRNLVTVTGKGEVFAAHDTATINFSVVEEATAVPEAQKKATEKINAVLVALRKSGIDDKDINTVGYNIYPKYEYDRATPCYANGVCPPYGKQVITGYEVSQSMSVKVREVEKAGEIIATVGGLKVSNVSGIDFTVDDEEKIRNEARDKAIMDAKDKAEKLADALGVKLVRLVNYGESGGSFPPYYAKEMTIGMGGDGAGLLPELPPGENKVTAMVTLTYEIR